MEKKYETLVLCGGAMKGFALLGAIQYLQDKDLLQHINRFIGTSIGGIISYFICIGYSPTELMIRLHQENAFFEKFQNLNLVNLIHGMGAMPYSFVQDLLERMTVEKVKRYITLRELYEKYDKELVLCVFNETLHREEYISYKTHPEMNCITALRMTSSLPFLFDPFVYEDYKYIDGGITNNFPIDHVKDHQDSLVLGITFQDEFIYQNKSENLLTRIYRLFYIPYTKIEEMKYERILQNENISIIKITNEKDIGFSFSMTSKEKFDLFSVGYDSIKQFFYTPENSGSCSSNTL